MGKPDDSLDVLFEKLLEKCRQPNLTVFRGYIHPEEHEVVDWDEAAGDLWAFMDAAIQVGTRMVYVHAWKLTEDDLDTALEEDLSEGGERQEELEAFREHVGRISLLQVLFRFDGVFHAWTSSPEWYDAFCALRDAEEEEFLDEEEDEAEDIDEPEVRPPPRTDMLKRARDLKQQGFTLSQIAARLNLKSAEVRKLLGEE